MEMLAEMVVERQKFVLVVAVVLVVPVLLLQLVMVVQEFKFPQHSTIQILLLDLLEVV